MGKLKNIWHITYHGDNFTSLNKSYKNGWTITTLKKVKENDRYMYKVDKIIKSVDPVDHHSFKRTFWANTTNSQVIDDDPHVIIKWFFEEFGREPKIY